MPKPPYTRAPVGSPVARVPAALEVEPPRLGGAALGDWAAQHGVLGLVRGEVGVLGAVGDLPDSLLRLASKSRVSTLAEALELEHQALTTGEVTRAARLATEVRAFLRAEIAEARRSAEPEPAPPSDPTLRDLARRLLELRARVRTSNAPAGRRYDVKLGVLPSGPLVVASLSRRGFDSLDVEMRLEHKVRATCECSREATGCQHVLAAIDAIVAAMSDARSASFQKALVAALHAPWTRALGELEAIVEASAAATGPGQTRAPVTGWRLRSAKHGFRLVPCVLTDRRTREVNRYEMAGGGWKPIDHAVMGLIEGYMYGAQSIESTRLAAALELLAGTGRLFLAEGARTRPLVVKRAHLELCSEPVEDGLRLWLALDGRELADEDLARVPARGGTFIRVNASPDGPAEVALAEIDAPLALAWTTLTRHGHIVPSLALDGLGRLAPRLAQHLAVRLPESLLGRALPAAPRAVLRLEDRGGEGLGVTALVRVHPGASAQPPGQGPRDVFVVDAGERCHVRRDLEGEAAWLAPRLAGLGLPDAGAGPWVLAGDAALDLVARLDDDEVRTQLDLEWAASAPLEVLRQGALRVEVREKRDWFSLSGGLDVDGEHVALAELLAALRAGRRYVRVTGARWLSLGESLRRQLHAVADLTSASGATLELPAMAAPLLEDALGERLAAPPLRFRELVARARAAASAPPTPVPALGVTLRDYQVAGFEWMSRLAAWGAGACLADDMGLGKTIQALALLAARASLGPALVIAPTSVGWNWAREAERCAPGLRSLLFARSERDAVISAAGPGDVIIASYGLVVRHEEAFAARRFATLVLDEAHALKNPATRRAQAVTTLQADFKLALTGTPLENRLSELWSLFRVVAPGLLGGLERFRERFALPIERDHDEARRAALARLTRPFLLRRLKREVARELPPRTEVQVDVALAQAERRVYDAIRVQAAQALGGDLGGDRRFAVLAALTRLRQAACDVGLLDASITTPSSKLARLVELVDELRQEGHRVLVFSQFTSLLERARAAVAASGASCLYLDGATPEARRAELVDAFQAGRGDAFFISLKAGGAGLNLTGADNVIHLDPWWNPAVEDQATDRAHRIGQERPVTVYRLVATGTVEEAILKLHADKRALVAGVLEGAAGAATLDAAQLAQLISASSEVAFDDEPAESSEPPAEVVVAGATTSAVPSTLASDFREHLLATGSKASTASTYTAAAARWLATRSPRERAPELARAALAAADGPGDDLPKTTRAALRRLSAMLAP